MCSTQLGKNLGKKARQYTLYESCALSVLFLCVWYLLRWESRLMEELPLSRQYYKSVAEGLSYRAYDFLLITGDVRAIKNPGRFEGDSCFGGYEGDGDPMRSERGDDCDRECERDIKTSARTCQSPNCRMRFTYDNATRPHQPLLLSDPYHVGFLPLTLRRHCFRNHIRTQNVEDISSWSFNVQREVCTAAECMEMHDMYSRSREVY